MKEAKCERQRHEGKIPSEMGHSIVRAQTQKQANSYQWLSIPLTIT